MPSGRDTSRALSRRVNKVTVVSPAREMTPAEVAEYQTWLASTNLQERYENMDRRINFPPKSF